MKIVSFSATFGHYSPEPVEWLRARGYEVDLHPMGLRTGRDCSAARLADVVGIVAGLDPIGPDIYDLAPRLKVVCMHGAGFHHIDREAATQRGIRVCNAPGGNALAVAEAALGLCFSLARELPRAAGATAAGEWPIMVGGQVSDKTMGIVGLGKIGRTLAKLAGGLGMKLLAATRTQRPEIAGPLGVELTSLEDLLARADFVVLLTPITPETTNLIGERELALMKPTAFLLNLGRGGVVDEQALYRALKDGRPAGAALDVLRDEPSVDTPLRELPSVIITPHLAGYSREALLATGMTTVENLAAVLEGREPPFPVN
ncbi:MAG: phosphoglycerate dehydrogenase [Desulfarculaceae bacterium]|nr:phosphoglycerate dehydrogenase [Desulfarculaceae bacterium]